MHTVHHTEAFVLKVEPAGEANRRVWLYTKEFGLVVAAVQGVRKQGAKLQMNLREYTKVQADLVKGKDIWRLISVQIMLDPLQGRLKSKLARPFVRSLSVIERFCHGEDMNIGLFEHIKECMGCLDDDSLDPKSFDTVSVWKIFAHLGYVAIEESEKKLYELPLKDAVKDIEPNMRGEWIKKINEIISSTHL